MDTFEEPYRTERTLPNFSHKGSQGTGQEPQFGSQDSVDKPVALLSNATTQTEKSKNKSADSRFRVYGLLRHLFPTAKLEHSLSEAG